MVAGVRLERTTVRLMRPRCNHLQPNPQCVSTDGFEPPTSPYVPRALWTTELRRRTPDFIVQLCLGLMLPSDNNASGALSTETYPPRWGGVGFEPTLPNVVAVLTTELPVPFRRRNRIRTCVCHKVRRPTIERIPHIFIHGLMCFITGLEPAFPRER